MTGDQAVWGYAIAERIEDQWLDGVGGVDGRPVRTVSARGLSAAVTGVRLEEFGEAALHRHLEDLDWLDITARLHHEVIGILAGHGPVVPLRLATVFHGDGSVAELLTGRHDDLVSVLRQVGARQEWGAKVYAAPPERDEAAPPGDAPPGDAPGTGQRRAPGAGAAYLRRRKQALAADTGARRAAAESAEAVHVTLSRLAAAAQLRPPQAPQLSGQQAQMVLNAAYLVDDGRSEEFAAAAASVAGQHPAVRVELTGPWPPYSFATADLREPAGDGTPA